MFENIIGQRVTAQLTDDIQSASLPPSILLSGPAYAGKLTAALELARSVCCLTDGGWQCTCPSCLRHKEMMSPDLLIIGAKDHIPEIQAAAETLATAKTLASRYLFLRAVRKLTSRFDARLWDTAEQAFLKAAPAIAEIEELLSDLNSQAPETADTEKLQKRIEAIVSKSVKLQEECMYDAIPVNQVRKAASWIRLMPSGKKKILIIENADKMQEGARNAFLKILEEPPAYAVFVLTTVRRGAIMPTILSRVRTYTFAERSEASQKEVIARVFRKNTDSLNTDGRFNALNAFFYGFLPVDFQTIRYAAALFYETVFDMIGRDGSPPPAALYAAVNGYKTGTEPAGAGSGIAAIVTLLNKCKPRTVYTLFLNGLLSFLQAGLRAGNCLQKEPEAYFKITALIREAETAVGIFNISPQAALENLSEKMKEAFL